MTISRDEIERARLLSEYKGQVDAQSKIVHAKRMGLAEGESKGIASVARNALAQGASPDFFQKITGPSSPRKGFG